MCKSPDVWPRLPKRDRTLLSSMIPHACEIYLAVVPKLGNLHMASTAQLVASDDFTSVEWTATISHKICKRQLGLRSHTGICACHECGFRRVEGQVQTFRRPTTLILSKFNRQAAAGSIYVVAWQLASARLPNRSELCSVNAPRKPLYCRSQKTTGTVANAAYEGE